MTSHHGELAPQEVEKVMSYIKYIGIKKFGPKTLKIYPSPKTLGLHEITS